MYIERDKWGIDPGLIVQGTMYHLTHLSVVLLTPNIGVVDEKCAVSLCYFDLLGQAVTMIYIPCILGSDTGCMT